MKNYLSFGGGVNSVALHLMLLDQGVNFEAVFVHHATDYPETYNYLAGFQWWLKNNGHKPITILRPNVDGRSSLYLYCRDQRIIPSKMFRWCTDKFKTKVVTKYVQKPCFMMLGIDYGEAHRAKINYQKKIENRFPLIEEKINRDACKEIITRNGLPLPIKSGCFICPFQKPNKIIDLRYNNTHLFCKAQLLETRAVDERIKNNKKPIYLFGSGSGQSIASIIDEKQMVLWKEDEYPPCQCGL